MASRICREISLSNSISVTNSLSTTGSFVMGQDAGGLLYVSSPNADTTLTFYVDPQDNGTNFQLYDNTNTAVSLVVSAGAANQPFRCYPIPDALFGAGKVRVVGSASATIRVGLKT